ncbi:hypothetical protein EJ05DRAFT_54263 [Pseudovirgaria hyperparasitica]|uniref:Geranylgeranyl pyrophosphate synthetase n=1 Tax=Pseudovirgaria hyperparasitica TaxID=470096 RepID=A0A6A6W3B0_9PEZI|nr:uncharacterized protein EJ05DRAFT_54263 [Pseudovirgaria hyperparasitica]KAF2757055.1 hypothetical protein EJ05DRAFT_54263 [Pseudovirgaria hyperparasitica]
MRTSIKRSEFLEQAHSERAEITNVKLLASYNWLEAPLPCAPLWLESDAKRPALHNINFHSYGPDVVPPYPKCPAEPLFRALKICSPCLDINTVDLVTDRVNIKRLFLLIRGKELGFMIQGELVGKTAILHRVDPYERHGPELDKNNGFGKPFDKPITFPMIDNDKGHQRIVGYQFAGISMIVRSEIDAYVDSAGVLEAFVNKQVVDRNPPPDEECFTNPTTSLTVRHVGWGHQLETAVEIKTRDDHEPVDFNAIGPQMWISQTYKLVRARRDRASPVYERPCVQDISELLKDFEDDNQEVLQQLAGILHHILSRLRGSASGRVTVRWCRITQQILVTSGDEPATPSFPADMLKDWGSFDTY